MEIGQEIVIDSLSLLAIDLENKLKEEAIYFNGYEIEIHKSLCSIFDDKGVEKYTSRLEIIRSKYSTKEMEQLRLDQYVEDIPETILEYFTIYPKNLKETIDIAKKNSKSNSLLTVMETGLICPSQNVSISTCDETQLISEELVVNSGINRVHKISDVNINSFENIAHDIFDIFLMKELKENKIYFH